MQTVQGAVRLRRTAPLPAPGNRFLVFPPEELLEMENDSGGNAQVVLCLVVTVGDFRQMRQQVVELQRADRETVAHVPVDANAERRRERRVGVRCGEHVRTGARSTDQNLAEGRDPTVFPIGEAGAKKIRKYMIVHVHATIGTHVIAAEIADTAQPVPKIIGRRSAASVEIETVKSRSCRIRTEIRVADGRIYLR